jgi:formate dehydrogenase subunit delta
MSDIDQLIKMANQISENFSFHEDQVERTVDHIQRFWAPPMRKKLFAYAAGGGGGLSEPVIAALNQLEA